MSRPLRSALPLGLVAAVLALFVLWVAWSGDSRWQRDDGAVTATAHTVRFGLLSYAGLEASRGTPGGPWSVSTGYRTGALLWTVLLTLPVLWLARASSRRWRGVLDSTPEGGGAPR